MVSQTRIFGKDPIRQVRQEIAKNETLQHDNASRQKMQVTSSTLYNPYLTPRDFPGSKRSGPRVAGSLRRLEKTLALMLKRTIIKDFECLHKNMKIFYFKTKPDIFTIRIKSVTVFI